MIWGYLDILDSKNHTRKINKILKDFWVIPKLSYIIFCLKMFSYPEIILPTRAKRIFTSSTNSLPLCTRLYYLPILSVKIDPIYFSDLLESTSPTIFLDVMLQASALCWYIFYMLCNFQIYYAKSKVWHR